MNLSYIGDKLYRPSSWFSIGFTGFTIPEKSDLEFAVLCKDENWYARGVKEAIAIIKLKPTRNLDEGRYNLSPMYDKFIRTSLVMKTPSQGAKEGTEKTTRAEEGGRQSFE